MTSDSHDPTSVTQVRNAPISIQNVVTYDVVIAVDNFFGLYPANKASKMNLLEALHYE